MTFAGRTDDDGGRVFGPTGDGATATDATDGFDAAVLADIDTRATAFVGRVTAPGRSAAAIAGAVAEIDNLGASEIHGTSAVTAAMLEPDARLIAAFAGSGGSAGRALDTLRRVVATLDPRDAGLDGDPRSADRYSARVEQAKSDAEEAVAVLSAGRDGLAHENAVLAQQERALWLQMTALRRLAHLTRRIDELLAARIATVTEAEPDRARRLSVDVLLPVRRRRRDLLTHLAVAAQGYAAIRIVESTNGELLRTIDAAVDGTITAIRAASLAVRITATDRQLGQPTTERRIREAMAAATTALTAVNRSRSDVVDTMHATIRSLHAGEHQA